MSMRSDYLQLGHRRFSIPDRSGHLFGHARGYPGHVARRFAAIGAGRYADQLGEARAEGAKGRAADLETDIRDAEIATPKQRHRAFDPAGHQVAVWGLA